MCCWRRHGPLLFFDMQLWPLLQTGHWTSALWLIFIYSARIEYKRRLSTCPNGNWIAITQHQQRVRAKSIKHHERRQQFQVTLGAWSNVMNDMMLCHGPLMSLGGNIPEEKYRPFKKEAERTPYSRTYSGAHEKCAIAHNLRIEFANKLLNIWSVATNSRCPLCAAFFFLLSLSIQTK